MEDPQGGAGRGLGAALAGVTVVAVLAIGGAFLLIGGGSDESGDPGATRRDSVTGSEPTTPGTPAATPTAQASTTAGPQTTKPADPQAAALNELRRIVRRDDAGVRDRLAGSWVAQLDAAPKDDERPGTALRRHRELRNKYPAAVLLDSEQWSTSPSDRYWITLLADPHPGPTAPLQWCHGQGLTPNSCFARQLRTDGSWDGNIAMWPPA